MNEAVAASGRTNPHTHVTPFDQVLSHEEHEEARVKAMMEELERTEKEAQQAMRDAEATQEEKLREEARLLLREERDAIGREMERQEGIMQKELQALEADARERIPEIVNRQVETVLSPEFLSLAV